MTIDLLSSIPPPFLGFDSFVRCFNVENNNGFSVLMLMLDNVKLFG